MINKKATLPFSSLETIFPDGRILSFKNKGFLSLAQSFCPVAHGLLLSLADLADLADDWNFKQFGKNQRSKTDFKTGHRLKHLVETNADDSATR
jgi:hypothetical protein